MNKKLLTISTVVVAFFVGIVVLLGTNAHVGFVKEPVRMLPQKTIPQTQTISYPGQIGEDALTLLKQHATVVLGSSGMVIGINGQVADDKHHEYWAFYINGTMAQVGPAEYQTKNTDQIMWKIETY